ncbi:S1 family peptidase [Kutzneria kofuensis]|uniref:Secreted trypsin-like serine protease n=1 Tax=Kutzneria kofuensis TaxID=103725 RepID=A0A7W9NLD8_9PSEU|nr:serine protease [Kutzneria kofuensis]MBB5897577.1 secreted trypsin-like serine protease [Kutzneria kofuensis]
MRTLRMIALLTVTLLIGLSAAPPAEAIIGGRPADRAYPFMASLQTKFPPGSPFGQWCGASLIAPQWVITAGHCVHGAEEHPELYQVRIGSADNSTGGDLRSVTKIVTNPGYGSWPEDGTDRYEADMALVKLNTPVPERPVHFGLSTQPQPVRAIGWGKMCADAGCTTYTAPKMLQQLDTEILSPEQCMDSAIPTKQNPWYEPCVGSVSRHANAAAGDSGGPVLAKAGGQWLLLGVCSHGPAVGDKFPQTEPGTAPNFYTSVPAHLAWILRTITT